jgi:S1-C subfamily serine protease
MRRAPGGGSEVLDVKRDGAARRAGIARGDLVTDLDGTPDPPPAAVERAFRAAPSGAYLLFAVVRDGAHLVIAVQKP